MGPCVAAPLAGALLYIGQSGDGVLGGAALFAMALGMGVPLLAIGASAGALLPKAGPWMETVNRFFGRGAARSRDLRGVAAAACGGVHAGVAALLIVFAVYPARARSAAPRCACYRKLFKGIGVISLLAGVALLIGVLSGGATCCSRFPGCAAQRHPRHSRRCSGA